MKKLILLAGAVTLLASPALADISSELFIGQAHAGMAAASSDLAKVHMHLQHALNCLIGPSGTGFDASMGNPCKTAGNGAIPDSMNAAQKAKLQMAVSSAQAGIASSDLMTAQKDAKTTADAIAAAK